MFRHPSLTFFVFILLVTFVSALSLPAPPPRRLTGDLLPLTHTHTHNEVGPSSPAVPNHAIRITSRHGNFHVTSFLQVLRATDSGRTLPTLEPDPGFLRRITVSVQTSPYLWVVTPPSRPYPRRALTPGLWSAGPDGTLLDNSVEDSLACYIPCQSVSEPPRQSLTSAGRSVPVTCAYTPALMLSACAGAMLLTDERVRSRGCRHM